MTVDNILYILYFSTQAVLLAAMVMFLCYAGKRKETDYYEYDDSDSETSAGASPCSSDFVLEVEMGFLGSNEIVE